MWSSRQPNAFSLGDHAGSGTYEARQLLTLQAIRVEISRQQQIGGTRSNKASLADADIEDEVEISSTVREAT